MPHHTRGLSAFIPGTSDTEHRVRPESPFTQYQAWLAETSGVIGCPIDCQYCFFQVDGNTPIRPKRGLSPSELIALLPEQPTYAPFMPIHFGSKTDAFATRATIDYYGEVLREYGKSTFDNPLIFITKKRIPEHVLDIAAGIRQQVLFYISFSGLGGSPVEPLVNSEDSRSNLKNLRARKMAAVHYWRPFAPQNSARVQLNEMLAFVSEYASCSVINGLRLSEGIRTHMVHYWPELGEMKADLQTSGEFWPEGVRGYLSQLIREEYPHYPVYFGNTPCSIAHVRGLSDLCGHYNEPVCTESNCLQRDRCARAYRVPTDSDIGTAAHAIGVEPERIVIRDGTAVLQGALASEKITYLRFALRFPVVTDTIDYSAGYNWPNVRQEARIVEVPWKQNWT